MRGRGGSVLWLPLPRRKPGRSTSPSIPLVTRYEDGWEVIRERPGASSCLVLERGSGAIGTHKKKVSLSAESSQRSPLLSPRLWG